MEDDAFLTEGICRRLMSRGFRWTIQEKAGKMAGEPEDATGENRGNRVKGMIVKGIKIRKGGHYLGAERGSVNKAMSLGREPLMNTDRHGFQGAEKRVSRRAFRSLFGGSMLTQEEAHRRTVSSKKVQSSLKPLVRNVGRFSWRTKRERLESFDTIVNVR